MDRIASWLQAHWDHRAAGNFIGGGTGSGLAIVAAAMTLSSGRVLWLPFVAAALFIVTGLCLVWLEIGRPWRFLHVFFNPYTSWMTREALIAPPLLAALACAIWFGGAAASVAVLALGLAFLYTQSRILRASMGIPAWREPRIVPLILAFGLAEGVGAFIVLSSFPGGATPRALAGGLALLLVVGRWLAWMSYSARFSRDPSPVGTRRVLQACRLPFTTIGMLAPLALLAAALWFPAAGAVLAPLAGLLVVASGWLVKYMIITRAAFNQGFALPRLPKRGAGASGGASRPGWT
jgi:phenylacetyl-CoA:acceptor oxidoreductase subunit 2